LYAEARLFELYQNHCTYTSGSDKQAAVAAIFYIENSSAAEMTENWKELVTLLKSVLKKDGIEIIRAIMDRIYQIHDLPSDSKTI